jgi:2-dehydro-3-deoxygluconokinase
MTTGLTIRPGAGTRYDLVSLGEVMLRLDPGEGRIRNSRSFTAREGGGEYNVARGLRRCFGLRTAIVTALADNRRLAQDVDVILGNEEDFTACLGLEVEGTDGGLSTLPAEGSRR